MASSPSTDSPPTLEAARQVMEARWGYSSFRPGQEAIVEAVLQGRDVLGVLPTGGGKSLCYQVPALLLDGFAIVISPLIALMQDQVDNLRARGIEAAYINSTLRYHEIDQRWTDAEHGRYDLLYLAPERLTTDLFQARAHRLNVSLLAVDEAHCVSEWGHNFRPDYHAIPEARELLDRPPTLAVTATATPAVRKDVIELLDLDEPAQIVRGFDRPNLLWSVFRSTNKRAKARDVVEAVEGTGILYTSTRRGVNTWTAWLKNQGFAAEGYHGGLSSGEREAIQNRWVQDETRIIVATNAFGMGIDKPDVRFVIHVDVPASLEAYYQEAGRGGRDGKTAYAVLLYREPDAETQEALLDSSHPTAAEVRRVYDAVCNVGQIPIGSEPDGPLVVNTDAVLRIADVSRGKMRTAVDLLERQGAWQVLPPRKHYGLIRFSQPANRVRRYAQDLDNRALTTFVQELLRTVHADAFSDWWRMDFRLLERRLDLERDRLQRGLTYLQDRGIVQWRPPGGALQVELAFPRASKLPVDDTSVQNARVRAEKRLDAMLRYAGSMACRRRFLLTYFGEASPERCGTCDVCLGRHRPEAVTPEDEPVLRAILDHVAVGDVRREWFPEGAPAPTYRIDALTDWLVAEGYLHLEAPLEGRFVLTETGEAFVNGDG